MIWVGVLPDTLTGKDMSGVVNSILTLLEDKDIADVDIEFWESVFRHSTSAELYEPADDLDTIRHVIDPLTITLGLPIAAWKTPHIQGTMGFYFKDGNELYSVTACHVLF